MDNFRKIWEFITLSLLAAKYVWMHYGMTALLYIPIAYGLIFLHLYQRHPAMTNGMQIPLLISVSMLAVACLLITAPLGRYRASLPAWMIVPAFSTWFVWQSAALFYSGQLDSRTDVISSAVSISSVSGGLAWLITLGILKQIPERAPKKTKEAHGPYEL